MKIQRKNKGLFSAIIASISYGTNPLFALPMYAVGLTVNSVLFYRYLFATILYGVWLVFIKRLSLKISLKQFFGLLVMAGLFSASSITLFGAFKYIDGGIACTILFIYPLMVACIEALFFREKLTKNTLISIGLSLAGIILLYQKNGTTTLDIRGVLLVLLSALVYALYMVGVKHLQVIKHIKRHQLAFYVMFFGLFVYIINSKFCINLQFFPNFLSFICALGLALFPTIISIETINVAIKLIGSTKTSIIGALEPLTALVLGVILFHESISFRIVIGVFLILFGVSLTFRKRKNK